MSKLFPAGGNKKSWLDRLNEVEVEDNIKTASAEDGEPQTPEKPEEPIGVDAIPMEELQRLAQFSLPQEDVSIGEADVVEVDVGEADVGEAVPAIEGELPVPEAEPVSEEEAGDPLNEAAEAVADAQDALEDASTALGDAGADVADEAEIPVDIDEETGDVSIEEEGVIDVEIEPEESGPIAKAEEVPTAAPVAAPVAAPAAAPAGVTAETEETKEVVAEDSSRFVKIAKLSPDNKKKLADYWIKSLGYDSKYVQMMLKDYKG